MPQRLCRACNGSGRIKCPRCDGHGTMESGETCYHCKGDRMVKCNACNGSGKVEDK